MKMNYDNRNDEFVLRFSRSEYEKDPTRLSVLAHLYLEPVHIKIASKIIAKVRFPKYRTSSLS